jgi:hypothetical protein
VGGRRAVRVTLAGLLLAVSAAACNSSSGADRGAAGNTVATEPALTTTTNPYAVPAVIDIAYVNRVLAGLDAAVGDVLRVVMSTKTIPPEAYDRLKAIYAEPTIMQIKIDGYQRDIREQFRSYRPAPGNRASTVSRLLSTRSNCIFVEVRRDYSAVGLNPIPELDRQWVGLTRLDASRDPNGYNRTAWALIYDGFPPDRSQPPDPCAS